MNKEDLKWYREHGYPETVVNTAEEIANKVEKFYNLVFDFMFISKSTKTY